jgi:hypothetical protein
MNGVDVIATAGERGDGEWAAEAGRAEKAILSPTNIRQRNRETSQLLFLSLSPPSLPPSHPPSLRPSLLPSLRPSVPPLVPLSLSLFRWVRFNYLVTSPRHYTSPSCSPKHGGYGDESCPPPLPHRSTKRVYKYLLKMTEEVPTERREPAQRRKRYF